MKNLLLIVATLFGINAMGQTQAEKDDKILQDYFKAQHIHATKTASGLYYVITTPGSGAKPAQGQKVSMGYFGKLVDGQKFDANMDANGNVTRPFTFTLGVGQVIRGWDEGVALLSKGTKATLYIPSGLGYGARNMGKIPPNSVLIFDVQVLDIQ
jgi:FKBP-type peptidyl-prolyl cis-trans isomerase FkpA